MQISNLSKPFSVDVYSDRKPLNESPWFRVGEFDELSDAIEASKKVVDEFLYSPINVFISSEKLVTAFLSYGDVPTINGTKNLNTFNVYEYVTQRSREISGSSQDF